MQATLARSLASSSESSDRRVLARVAGAVLLICIISVLVIHAGPASIGGQRVSGTSDVSLVRAFYSHSAMVWFWWQGGISLLGLALFAFIFRSYLRTFALGALAKVLTDAAAAIMVVEVAVLAVTIGMQAAMVQLVAAGAPDGALLSVFATWDWIYNSFTYWFEFGWMFLLAALAFRARALPSWICALGGVASVGLLLNSITLLIHVPDSYTLAPTVIFVAWFAVTSIYLLRGGSDA